MGAASLVIRGIVFLIGVPFLLFGLFVLLVSGLGAYGEYQQTQGVVSTEGTVVSTSIDEGTTNDDGITERVYYPRATYTYSVDGREYEGQWIYAPSERGTDELRGRSFEDLSRAQDVVRKYREGQSVTVHYYEGNPGEPFLERPGFEWGTLIVGLLFGGIPLLIGVVLSGGALFFGQLRKRFGGTSSRRDHDVDVDDEQAGWDDEEADWDDDDGDGGGDGGGGWGIGGFDGGGGDGGGGGGE